MITGVGSGSIAHRKTSLPSPRSASLARTLSCGRSGKDAGTKLRVKEEFEGPIFQQKDEYSRNLLDSFIETHEITSVLIDNEEESFFARTGSTQAEGLDCHTVIGTGMNAFESPTSILVPVARGPHSGLAIRIAEAIATAYDCWIELFHVIPEDAPEELEDDATKLLETYDFRVADSVDVDYHVLREPDPTDAIIEHSDYHDLTILGAPEKGKLIVITVGLFHIDRTQPCGRSGKSLQ